MAIISTLSNHAKFQLGAKEIDFANDVFKAILMNTTFAFDQDAHATLALVTADQIATGGGYTQDAKVIVLDTYVEDDTGDQATATFLNPTWTGSGGGFGPTGALIIYDDTTTDDTVIFCADFGEDFTVGDGINFQPQGITVNIA